MGNKVVSWAWEQQTDRPIDKMVLVALADYAAKDGFSYPSHRELADMAQCSPDSVQRALKRLIARGLIVQETRWRANGGRSSNGYTVLYLGPNTRPKSDEDDPPPLPQTAGGGMPQAAAPPMPQTAAGPTAPSGGGIPQLCGRQYDPSLNPSPEPSPPQPPRRRPANDVCVSGGKLGDDVLKDLTADGRATHVVENFIRPLWGALRLPAGVDPLAFLAGIREELASVEPEVLERAATLARRGRTVWPSAAQAYELANKAALDVPLQRFWRDTAAYRAWIAHYRATGREFWARECESREFVLERSAVPPIVKTSTPGKAA